MQLEIYNLIAEENRISVSLEAICDSYSSLLWDIEFYQCGCFEVYIAASPQNVSIFQRGRIVAKSDDAQHFGIIESLQLETDAEKGDYLTVTGRFLACLLERRIIYPTITANGSYEDIVRKVLSRNVISAGIRNLLFRNRPQFVAGRQSSYRILRCVQQSAVVLLCGGRCGAEKLRLCAGLRRGQCQKTHDLLFQCRADLS